MGVARPNDGLTKPWCLRLGSGTRFSELILFFTARHVGWGIFISIRLWEFRHRRKFWRIHHHSRPHEFARGQGLDVVPFAGCTHPHCWTQDKDLFKRMMPTSPMASFEIRKTLRAKRINGGRVMPIEASWSRCRCSTVCLKAKDHQLASSPAARRCTRVVPG